MTDNPDALRVAVDGGKCYIAEIGATVPTGMEAFGGQWRDLGLISDDGVNEAYEEERTNRTPWGYKSPARSDVTSVTRTFQMTCWETNAYTRALYDNVAFADIEELDGGVIHFPVKRPEGRREFMLAIDAFDGTNHIRTIVGKAEITSRGEQVNSAQEVIGYNFTWTAYEQSDMTLFDRYVLASGVWLPVETLTISGEATVVTEMTEQLTANAAYFDDSDEDVSSDAEWESGDESVATVDSSGEVTGVSAGTTSITATYRGRVASHEMEVTAS